MSVQGIGNGLAGSTGRALTASGLVDIASFAIKVRKAKGSADRLDHIDVFVGLAGVVSALVRWSRRRPTVAE